MNRSQVIGGIGAAGLLALGGWAIWSRRASDSVALQPTPTPTDPDPETEPSQSFPVPEENVSELILDRREEGIAAMKRREEQFNKRYGKGPGSRDATKVDSLVLHQTGFTRGDDPSKYLKVTAHFMILPNGQIVWIHPFDEYLYASNKLNSHSVAVEFVGNFAASNGKWWSGDKFGRHTVSDAQIEAGRYLVKWLMEVLPNFRAVYAHRQSNANKGNGPGPDIWRGVGEYAIHELGLVDTRDETVGSGKAIPESWRQDGARSNYFAEDEGPSPTHHDEAEFEFVARLSLPKGRLFRRSA